MTYNEPYIPIDPPEIRHPQETLVEHEFYVSFDGRYDLKVLELIMDWLKKQPPVNPVSITFTYHRETEEEPALFAASLILGAPVDVG